jgi:KipI family sensor histidine kinase inhibitor
VPAIYGGEFGPDLESVTEQLRLSPAEVVARHTASIQSVYMIGFAPGFAYVGDLPAELALPRRATPRERVPAGSVAIAGRQTGIYPRSTPGGWHLIARTPINLFDPARDPPAYLRPGDRVQFIRIQPTDWDRYTGPPQDW